VNSKTAKPRVLVLVFNKMATNIRDIGRQAYGMVLADTLGKTAVSTLATSKMVSLNILGSTSGLMAITIMVASKRTRKVAQAST
jgi:hypothetical protein